MNNNLIRALATLADTWHCGICGAGPFSSHVAMEVHIQAAHR